MPYALGETAARWYGEYIETMTSHVTQDWEATARLQAARGDYLIEVIRAMLAAAGADDYLDPPDDRLCCEQCCALGWPVDGFYRTNVGTDPGIIASDIYGEIYVCGASSWCPDAPDCSYEAEMSKRAAGTATA